MSLNARRALAPLVTVAACLATAAFVSPRPISASTTPDLAQAVAALQARANVQDARIASLQSTVEHQQVTINALQKKTAPLTLRTDTDRADGAQSTEMYFTGVNVHIVDGSGYTNDNTNNGGALLGLGNLIVGYNELRGIGNGDNRTGSHNLIVGTRNNYGSFGGVVFGNENSVTMTGHYAVVTGGTHNTASGIQSAVTGGYSNTASSYYSSVTGGRKNYAIGPNSSIIGGYSNTASGYLSSVISGAGNRASGDFSTATGGQNNTANGDSSNVTGGFYNSASNFTSSVTGGYGNNASGSYASVTGGDSNNASGDTSSVTGGKFVQEDNQYGFAAGGQYGGMAPGPGTFHSP